MTCETIQRRLGLYVDGELDGAEVSSFDSHLEICPRCRDDAAALSDLARRIAAIGLSNSAVPTELWSRIDQRLHGIASGEKHASGQSSTPRWNRWLSRIAWRKPWTAAACLAALLVSWIVMGPLLDDRTSQVQAAGVDFGSLLDEMNGDARAAFRAFLSRNGAEEASLPWLREYARGMSFAVPRALSGGFRLEAAYAMRLGGKPAAAASYDRRGELLAVIFHPPVLHEHFGTHKDHECVVGQHRGHKVPVGEWSLVHITDATTCHCVLSRLDETTELPRVLAEIAPGARPGNGHMHD